MLYHAGLTLKAHADTPILALEELDSLLSTVSCSNSSVTLVFHDSATAKKVAGEWARNEKWVLVTAHESCGGENDRTPYLYVSSPVPIHRALTYAE